MVFDGGDAAAWSQRTEHFGKLVPFRRNGEPVLGMELLQPRGYRAAESAQWRRLRGLWGDLDYTFPIIDVLEADDSVFLLRYAAINWGRVRLDTAKVDLAARWLVELADVYKLLVEDVPGDVDAFCAPLVHVDLDDHLRIAFTSYAPDKDLVPPEVKAGKPWDERALVFLVGKLFEGLVTNMPGSRFESVYRACIDEKPANRWPSFSKLITNVASFRIDIDEVRDRPDLDAWRAAEEGIGWLQLGYLDQASSRFERALSSDHYRPLARWGLERAGIQPSPQRSTGRRGSVYLELPAEPVRTQVENLELAREALAAGDTGYAGVIASKLLASEPGNNEAMMIITLAHLRNRHYDRALKQIDKMQDSGRSRYLRGKALLGIGRLHEARDAFDLAFDLDPKLLEAMLLRREADRLIRMNHREVGEQTAIDVYIPASLAELRDILLSGDVAQAISALETPPYSEQPEAQLKRGHLLAFTDSHASAIAAFDRAVAQPELRFDALLGKARSFVALGKTESALAIFDQLSTERPTDADASEGRARALERLGRLGEAAAEFRRFISLSTSRSDVRVRAAAEWLRDHPL